MFRIYILSILIGLGLLPAFGMEYGLRFNSHSFPASKRTSLSLSEKPFPFVNELSVGFDMAFYEDDKFGLICNLTGNDGTTISLVSSSDGEGYKPAIVINNEIHKIPLEFVADPENPIRPIIILKRHENKVLFLYGKNRFSFPTSLQAMTSVTISFGRNATQESTAPIEIRDVRVFTEKKNTHNWELRKHDGNVNTDELSGVSATAQNAHWIIDDHILWTEIYKLNSSEKLQTAYDVVSGKFYIASENEIRTFDPNTNLRGSIPVKNDGRVMKYSNHLMFDTISGQLLSYNFHTHDVSRFDFSTESWDRIQGCDDEPRFANHSTVTDGRHAYMFGGYGFYLYHNNLFRIDLVTDQFEEFTLQPLPEPRTSSAMCITGNYLYIFGGKGNTVGKQEIPSVDYYDLWEYDLSTMSGRKVWELDSVPHHFNPSAMMYYVEKDSAFYAASTLYGGTMLRISKNEPSFKIVSEPIHSNMDYRDCVFNLYQSIDKQTYYLVIDKRLDDLSHDYTIYQIRYPFSDELLYDNFNPSKQEVSYLWIYITAGVIFVLLLLSLGYRKRKLSVKCNPHSESTQVKDTLIVSAEPSLKINEEEMPNVADTIDERKLIIERPSESEKHFARERSSISVLGHFEVKDKNGEDITPKFTSRIKDLLLMLILYTEKEEKGVSFQKLDDEIWFDKNKKLAKNNRNVYMRRLRLLLEEVGDIEIIYDSGYYRIKYNNVFVDYHASMSRLKQEELTGPELDETIELLLMGPLLPDTVYPWIDPFKSLYTDISLRVLYRLMEHGTENDDLSYRIAETIQHHDPLSEEALMTMCRILYKRGMKGPAKTLYDNFSREYANSFGEEYSISFSSVLSSEK